MHTQQLNPYVRPLENWLIQTQKTTLTWPEILRDFLQNASPALGSDPTLQRQIAAALTGLHWRPAQVWRAHRLVKIWHGPSPLPTTP